VDNPPSAANPGTRRSPHPALFAVLNIPFGAAAGYVGVALAFLATRRGLSVAQGSVLVAVTYWPQVLKVFYAPVADTTLTRKRWYFIAMLFCAAGMFLSALVPLGPSTLPLMTLIVTATSFATTFMGFAVEGLVAHLTLPEDRPRTSGWYQAGNLGGSGIGGGLGLWLLTRLPYGWETGLIMAACVLACGIALLFLPDVVAEARELPLGGTVRLVAREFWGAVWSRDGILCALLCLVPIGTGAASTIMAQAEVAAHWHAGAGAVELVQGFLGGILSMLGCIAGGYGCSRFGGRVSYALYGGIMAAVSLAMVFLPATPEVYVTGNLAYSFATGLCYAAFTVFVLDTIGAGVAATKYNAFAAISNTPIGAMVYFLGLAQTHWGSTGMLLTDSAGGVVGILVFALVALLWKNRTRERTKAET
jgi:MFS transporter, PAT family, beta-lactamase induction signal transducer AmpG